VLADTLAGILAPTVRGLGYELLGVEQLGSGGGKIVRLYIDSEAGIGVEDCEKVSRQVSEVLDAEQAIGGEYTLEVSSPGLDRPLFTTAHFMAHVGAVVKVRLRVMVDGRRRLSGKLLDATVDQITIQIGEERINVPYNVIERAQLVPEW
jgi:ribosome maturation factor RimP